MAIVHASHVRFALSFSAVFAVNCASVKFNSISSYSSRRQASRRISCGVVCCDLLKFCVVEVFNSE